MIGKEELEARLTFIGPALRREKEGTTLAVTVIPHAPCNFVAGLRNNALLVKVSAAPEKGKANDAVLELIADFLGTASSNLRLLRGHSSRNKVILLQNMG